MANPGYPMQPMMQPPQMGQPMGAPPRAQVVRQGTSRAVPVVVSAGLAIGVFCGLLFGLGIDKDEAVAATTTSAPTKKKTDTDVPEPFQPTTAKVPPKAAVATPAAGSNTATPPAAGSNTTPPAAGSNTAATKPPTAGAGSATIAAVVKPTGKLTIEVMPEAIAKTAKITVDGKELEGNVFEIDLSDVKSEPKKKTVKVVVKASGYKDVEQKLDLLAGEEGTTYKVELVKRATGGGLPRPPPPGGGKKPPKKPPGGGLIDI